MKFMLICGNKKQTFMKRLYISLMTLLMSVVVSTRVFAQTNLPYYGDCLQIQLKVCSNEDNGTPDDTELGDPKSGNKPSLAPKKAPTIGQKDDVIYLYGQFGGLTLDLLSGGTQVYSALVPAGADEIVLPDDLSGIYELQLNDGSFVYSCEIEVW